MTRGEIRFEDVSFGYGREALARADGTLRSGAVIDGLTLDGASRAKKSA